MKCNRYAIYGWKSEKSKIKYDSQVLFSIPENAIDKVKHTRGLLDKAELCEGEIESQIELDEDPYMGGVYYSVAVRFKCKKCGYEYAGDNGLPSDIDSLNKFLTEVIKEKE
jgi:hypothetical protein